MPLNYTVEELEPDLGLKEVLDIYGLFEVLSPGHKVPQYKIIDNMLGQALSDRDTIFVARLDTKRIVGMAAIHLVPKGLGIEGRLEDVATYKEYEGNGIAKATVSACVDWARTNDSTHVELTSDPVVRERANGIYESMGFKIRPTNVRRLNLNGS